MAVRLCIAIMVCLLGRTPAGAQDSLRCGFGRGSFNVPYDQWYRHAVEHIRTPAKRGAAEPDTTYIIPVVLHYIQQAFIIDYQLMHDRIAQLNADFRRRNADTVNLRSIFRSRVGDARIEFVLADSTPDGLPSQGYTRTRNYLTFGIDKGTPYSQAHKMKFDSTGGIKPWDTRKYLNIWICDLTTPKGFKYMAGFATPPFNSPNWSPQYYGDSLIDGVVIDRSAWLSSGNRTLTHEVGHYLGLRHVSGDPSGLSLEPCLFDDSIFDTPRINGQNLWHCDKSTNTCIEAVDDMPDMLENYMDYTADCRNSFTKGQVALMRYCLKTLRKDIFDLKIDQPKEPYREKEVRVMMYPNVMQDKLYVEFTDSFSQGNHLVVYDMLGRKIVEKTLVEPLTVTDVGALSGGIYIAAVKNRAGDVLTEQRLLK